MLDKTTLTALFHDLVRSAMATQQVQSSETTEFYLVQLLEAFARPGHPDLLDPPLALDYLQAFHLPAAKRYEKLKRVADTALFVTGHLRRQPRAEPGRSGVLCGDRAERLRATVRAIVAHGARGTVRGARGPLPEFARVLMEISAQELFRREQDTLRLYKRWLHTRGRHEADLLVRRGIIPFAPPTHHRH
jgi:hypothetical protein